MANITREEAVEQAVQLANGRNWSLTRCAAELGVNRDTLKSWLREAGWTCQMRRVWVKKTDSDS